MTDAPDTEVKVNGGKYTVILKDKGGMEFLRYGEPWPAANDLKHVNMIFHMAAELDGTRALLKKLFDACLPFDAPTQSDITNYQRFREVMKEVRGYMPKEVITDDSET